MIGEVETSELDAAELIGPEGGNGSVENVERLEVPRARLEGTTPPLVDLGDSQPVDLDRLGSADEVVRGPVGAPDSLVEEALREGMTKTEVLVVVKSVNCVVDTLVAMVVT